MVYQLKLPQRLAFLFRGHLHQKTNGKVGTNVDTQIKEVKLQRILLKQHDTNCPHFCWRSVCFLLQFHYNVLVQNRVHREAPFRKLQGIRSILGFEVGRVDSGAKDRFNSDCSCQGTVFERAKHRCLKVEEKLLWAPVARIKNLNASPIWVNVHGHVTSLKIEKKTKGIQKAHTRGPIKKTALSNLHFCFKKTHNLLTGRVVLERLVQQAKSGC